jgi:hypothetical protein
MVRVETDKEGNVTILANGHVYDPPPPGQALVLRPSLKWEREYREVLNNEGE